MEVRWGEEEVEGAGGKGGGKRWRGRNKVWRLEWEG